MRPNYSRCKVEIILLCCLETDGFICQAALSAPVYTWGEIMAYVLISPVEAKCVKDKSFGMERTTDPSDLNIHCAPTTSQLTNRSVQQAVATMSTL